MIGLPSESSKVIRSTFCGHFSTNQWHLSVERDSSLGRTCGMKIRSPG